MKIQDISDELVVNAFANTTADVASSLVILLDGGQIRTASGKSYWKSKVAAKNALHAHIGSSFKANTTGFGAGNYGVYGKGNLF